MKWDDDPWRYEKFLVMDAIIKFSASMEGKEIGSISIKILQDFIDEFFKKWKR